MEEGDSFHMLEGTKEGSCGRWGCSSPLALQYLSRTEEASQGSGVNRFPLLSRVSLSGTPEDNHGRSVGSLDELSPHGESSSE